MVRKMAGIIGEDKREGTQLGCESTIIHLEMDIFGRRVTYGAQVAEEEAALADIVPLARGLADRIACQTAQRLSDEGGKVSCEKGCSACCRYLVPLSVPEVFRMTEELLAMPAEPGAAILQSSIEAAKRIIDNRPPVSSFDECQSKDVGGTNHADDVGSWYADLELDCPLLREGLCAAYDKRPLACREHIVTGSPLLCEWQQDSEPHVVRMAVSVLDCLVEFAAALEGSEAESVMLPLALPWAQNNRERGHRKWPAPMMVERFFEIVQDKVSTSRIGDSVVSGAGGTC